jgi:hypothetical protein
MAIYYVSTLGNDSNNGGPATPWLTVQKALNSALSGDNVTIVGGTYSSPSLVFARSGVSGAPITFQTSGQVNIKITDTNYIGVSTNGQSYLNIIGWNITGANNYYGIDVYGGNHILLQNITVTNTKASGIYSENWVTYLTIDTCTLYGTNTAASEEMMSITQTSYFEIKNCILHDPASTQRINIDVKVACTNGTVHNNISYNSGSNGIYVDARGSCHDINIYCNLVFNCKNDTGIAVNDENGNSAISHIHIYNNIIFGCNSAFTTGHTGTETYTDVTFENNTCYNNYGWYGYEIQIGTQPAYLTACVIRNNILVETAANGATCLYDPNNTFGASKLLIDHNDFYNPGGWATGSVFGTNNITTNPLLNNPTTDFTLQTGSPCIGTGSSVGAPTTDFNGTTRTNPPCIGAYEANSTPPPSGGLPAGSARTANLSVTVIPSGISAQIEIWLGPDVNTKTVTSGKVPFTSTGVAQQLAVPITMPTAPGTYNVFIDLYISGFILTAYEATSPVVVVSGTAGQPVWQ